jgi:hypothetical protein
MAITWPENGIRFSSRNVVYIKHTVDNEYAQPNVYGPVVNKPSSETLSESWI